ncbi:MAG: FecR domain-containing protein, partial [Planctomycetota bacterium]
MSKNGKSTAEVLDLADAVCNGTAREAEVRRLSDLLRDDLGHVQAYVEHLDLHAELFEAADRQSAEEVAAVTFGRAFGHKRTGRRYAGFLAAAVSVAAAVAAVVTAFTLGPPTATPIGRVVAVAEGTTWPRAAAALEIDDVLPAGRTITVETGFVTVEIGSDVSVDLVAPVRASVTAEGVLRLDRGFVTGRVGPGGRGFTVTTEDARIVDLGTVFQVHKDFSSGTRVRVVEGRVEARLVDAAGVETKIVDLTAGQTLRLDHVAESADASGNLFDFDAVYEPVASAKGGVRRFSGAARPLSSAIVGLDLRSGVFETSGRAIVMPEATGVTLAEELVVGIDGAAASLPAGTTIDSYLVHYDVGRGSAFKSTGSGSVTFHDEVVA